MTLFLTNSDIWLNLFMQRYAVPPAEVIASLISTIADAEILIVVALVLIVHYALHKKWREMVIFTCSVGSTAVVVTLMKDFFMRVRPENALYVIIDDPSFPSGHASMAAAFFIALMAVCLPRLRSLSGRKWFIGISVGAIFLIGFSRLVLNVHWLSDVVAGWTIGSILAFISIWIAGRFFRK